MMGIFFNQGQVCCAGSRLFVQEAVKDQFLDRLKEKSAKIVVGDPMNKGTHMGPQVSQEQLNRVKSYADIARAEGATVVAGGECPTLEDFLAQIRSVKKMGPLEDLLKMLPGVPKDALAQLGPGKDVFKKHEAILLSMTPRERRLPKVLDGSRRKRIASGSGTLVSDVNRLIKDFEQARMMMKALKQGPRGLASLRGRMR